MDDIRIGLVGLGHRGLHWLRLLQRLSGYRITAVCDPIAALHDRALAAVDNPAIAYTAYDDILADGNVDAIALCVRCREQGALAARGPGSRQTRELRGAAPPTPWKTAGGSLPR